ncbi:hypothetical protein [Snuella lapsa]|uniref:Uncharacterized protein n=1 Tax=Snuella lapsa TaxID=870481 RepID=A0ABP6YHD8_9FLAO
MKKLFLLILLVSQLTFSQTITIDEGQTLKIKKVKIADGNIKSDSKENTKVLIFQCVIKSNVKKSVDINAFSLLDVENKIRYRLIRFESWKGKSSIGFGHSTESYLKTEILDKNGNPYELLPKYDPSKKDSFYDYNFDGFTNCEIPLDFGSNKRHAFNELLSKNKRLVSVVYFPESKWDEFFSQLQFPILIKEKKPKLELCYKKKVIYKIEYE